MRRPTSVDPVKVTCRTETSSVSDRALVPAGSCSAVVSVKSTIYHVNVHVRRECSSRRRTEAWHDIDDAIGDSSPLGELGEEERAERRLLGGLDDHGAAGGQGRGDLDGEHGGGEVPGDDDPGDAQGLAEGVALELRLHLERLAVDLVRRAGEVPQAARRVADVDGLGDGRVLPGVQALQRRQLVRVLLHQVSEPRHDPPPFGSRHAWPFAVVEGVPGCPHCRVHVVFVSLGDGGYHVPRARVPRLKRPA